MSRRALLRPAHRPLVVLLVVGISLAFGVGEFIRWNVGDRSFWAIDFGLAYRSAWSPYADPAFLWSPVAALLMRPVTVLPEGLAAIFFAGLKVAGLLYVLRGHRVAALAVLTFVPVLHDIELGNVWTVIGILVYLVEERDGLGRGVALGLLAAAVPKPMLVPIFVWLALHRRRAFLGAVAAGSVASIVALVALGPATWQTWWQALLAGTRFVAPFEGNASLSAFAPDLYLPVALAVTIGFGWVILRGRRALVWALGLGVLASPYAGQAAAAPMLFVRRLWTYWWLLPVAQIGSEVNLPLTVAAFTVLEFAGTVRQRRSEGRSENTTTRGWAAP